MTDTLEDRVFAALADGRRREILKRLANEGEKTATELAQELPITRQGVSKHLNILATASLVSVRQVGRDKRYSVTPQSLAEAVNWLESLTALWDQRLQALYEYLVSDEEQTDE
jgi:DNA-binding transcriptional ArsR family regulator